MNNFDLNNKINYYKIASIEIVFFVILIILFKSTVFLIMASSETGSNIDFNTFVYFSVPSKLLLISAYISIPVSFAFLLKRFRIIYLVITNFMISFILWIDLIYFRAFHTFPSIKVIKNVSNLSGVESSVLGLLHNIDVIFFIDFFFVFILIFIKKGNFCTNFMANISRNTYVFIFIISVSLIGLFYKPYTERNIKTEFHTYYKIRDVNENVFQNSPLGFHFWDIYYGLLNQKATLSIEDKVKIEKWFIDKKDSSSGSFSEYKGIFTNKNVVIIQFESLENSIIGQSINGKEITPNINKLLRHSIYFDNFHEQTSQGSSSDTDFAVLTSCYPLPNESVFMNYELNQFKKSMPYIFSNNGYETIAFKSVQYSFWNWQKSLSSLGFKQLYGKPDFHSELLVNNYIPDELLFKETYLRLKNQKSPFFAFLVTYNSHTPFKLPPNMQELGLDENPVYNYFESINYTDKHLGLFLNSLEESGILKNTVIIIYGDHEGISRYYPKEFSEMMTIQPWLKTNNKKVPLIIYNTGLTHKTISPMGGHIDLLPTLAYLFGFDSDLDYYTFGRNLFATQYNFVILKDGQYFLKGNSPRKFNPLEGIKISEQIIKNNYISNQ